MSFAGGDVVFCKIDEVLNLFEKVRLTRKRIILVTGEGDLPCDLFRQQFLPINIVRWFATNVTNAHPRVTALPLGLGSSRDSVTISQDQINKERCKNVPRDKWLYVNFRPQTNPSIREPVFSHFARLAPSESWIKMDQPGAVGGNDEFLLNLLTHRFVLCPAGNGVDTHRMWESLASGAIPVILRSQAMEPFRGLPILYVDRYEEVTMELLQEASRRIRPATLDEPMLQAGYWIYNIHSLKKTLQGNEIMTWGQWVAESAKYGAGMAVRKLGLVCDW